MSDQIVRLKASDFDEAMEMMNLSFSSPGKQADIQSLLPKLYDRDDQKMGSNLAVKRDGRIRAIVGLYPMSVHIGGHQLKTGGIGNVCTHPDDRNSGLMTILMREAEKAMKDLVLSVLGGQRQRYSHYGFEKAGTRYFFTVSKANLKNLLSLSGLDNIRFEPLDLAEPADGHLLAAMKAWHDRQVIHVGRSGPAYASILSSWCAKAWVARDSAGKAAGYLVCSQVGNTVEEILSGDPDVFLPMIASWVGRQPGSPVIFSLNPWQVREIGVLAGFAEDSKIASAYSFRIDDWTSLLPLLLDVRSTISPVPDGTLRLGIESGSDISVYELICRDGHSTCELCGKPADLVLDHLAATRMVLGPLDPLSAIPSGLSLNSAVCGILRAWFPLPLAWPTPDAI